MPSGRVLRPAGIAADPGFAGIRGGVLFPDGELPAQYVLRRQVLTLDKLYGAAAAFLMLGLLRVYLYSFVLSFYPGALTAGGTLIVQAKISSALLYFSFSVLSTTGFGDIVPVHAIARMLCVIEQVAGVLFIAILIARLAGTLPPVDRR
jgi:hypothetical protein